MLAIYQVHAFLFAQLEPFPHLFGVGGGHEPEFQQTNQRACCAFSVTEPVLLQYLCWLDPVRVRHGSLSSPPLPLLSSPPFSLSSFFLSLFFLSLFSTGNWTQLQAHVRQIFLHRAPPWSIFISILGQGLVKLSRLALKWQSSCLVLLSSWGWQACATMPSQSKACLSFHIFVSLASFSRLIQ